MGGILSPKVPAPPPPVPVAPPPPTKSDSDIRASRENERKRRLAAAGRKSTILTGGTGVTDEAPIQQATLLGT